MQVGVRGSVGRVTAHCCDCTLPRCLLGVATASHEPTWPGSSFIVAAGSAGVRGSGSGLTTSSTSEGMDGIVCIQVRLGQRGMTRGGTARCGNACLGRAKHVEDWVFSNSLASAAACAPCLPVLVSQGATPVIAVLPTTNCLAGAPGDAVLRHGDTGAGGQAGRLPQLTDQPAQAGEAAEVQPTRLAFIDTSVDNEMVWCSQLCAPTACTSGRRTERLQHVGALTWH